MLSQQAFIVDHQFVNRTLGGERASQGAHRQVSYRADLMQTVGGGVLEAGTQIQRLDTDLTSSLDTHSSAATRLVAPSPLGRASWLRSGYVSGSWLPTPQLTLSPGVRVADSTLSGRRAISPWILAKWSLAPDWSLSAGAGLSHQFPELDLAPAVVRAGRLRPESATHVDFGIEHRFSPSARWQVTVFAREERDVLRQNDGGRPILGGRIVEPGWPGWMENVLAGSARGVEVLLESRDRRRLSGWIAYSFGKARYVDPVRGESFWGDFDQRHSVTLAGVYRLTQETSLAVNLRGGSNFPIPGYFTAGEGGLSVTDRRNETRLPPSVRLDVRVTRSFRYAGRRFMLFAEVLNVLNRTNLGVADGVIVPETGQALGYTGALLPRLPLVGLTVEF